MFIKNGKLIFIKDYCNEGESDVIKIDSAEELSQIIKENGNSDKFIWNSLEDDYIKQALVSQGWIHEETAKEISESVRIGGKLFIYDSSAGYRVYSSPRQISLTKLHENKEACKTLATDSGVILCEVTLETVKDLNPEAFEIITKEKEKIIKRKEKAKQAAVKRKERARLKKIEEARKVLEEAGQLDPALSEN